jgi:sorbitol/mannitol transport system substrate-binding protein
MRPTLTRTSRNAAVTMYVNLLNNYGPPGSATPSTRSGFVQRRQVWPVDRCDNRCLKVDGVAYAQSPNAGVTQSVQTVWVWAILFQQVQTTGGSTAFIEWATSKAYIEAVGTPRLLVSSGSNRHTYIHIRERCPLPLRLRSELAATEGSGATDPKPYVEQPSSRRSLSSCEVGTAANAAALSGAKSVEDALVAGRCRRRNHVRSCYFNF